MARRLLTKENPGLFQAKSRSSGRGARVYLVVYLYFLWIERTHVTDHLIRAGQKTPNWPIEMTYLGEAEIAVRSNIKSRFGIMGFSRSDTIWGLWLFSLIYSRNKYFFLFPVLTQGQRRVFTQF